MIVIRRKEIKARLDSISDTLLKHRFMSLYSVMLVLLDNGYKLILSTTAFLTIGALFQLL